MTAPTLAAGLEFVQQSLGVAPTLGGSHPRMGTHNLLLSLGDSMFLEVIAIDPAAAAPLRPRWFALDSLTPNSAPRLASWVVRTTEIAAVANRCASIVGNVEPMTRGSLSWQITIPSDGRLPMDGAAPALIEWDAQTHPAQSLPLSGCRLLDLTVVHSDPPSVRTALDLIGFNPSGQVTLSRGPRVSLAARIQTPSGVRTLSIA